MSKRWRLEPSAAGLRLRYFAPATACLGALGQASQTYSLGCAEITRAFVAARVCEARAELAAFKNHRRPA